MQPFALAALARELSAEFAGAIVNRVSLFEDWLLFQIFFGTKGTAYLLFEISNKGSSVGYWSPFPPFVVPELFKTHSLDPLLKNGRILAIDSPGTERTLIMSLEKGDPLGRYRPAKMIFELLPGYANSLLVGSSGEVAQIFKPDQSGRLKTGNPYLPPDPPSKLLSLEDGPPPEAGASGGVGYFGVSRTLLEGVRKLELTPLEKRDYLLQGRATGAGIEFFAGANGVVEARVQVGAPPPLVGTLTTLFNGHQQIHLQSRFEIEKGKFRRFFSKKQEETLNFEKGIQRNLDKRAEMESEREEAQLLAWNLPHLKGREKSESVELPDYAHPLPEGGFSTRTVRLDSTLTLRENMEKKFNRIRKWERGIPILEKDRVATAERLAILAEVIFLLDQADGFSELISLAPMVRTWGGEKNPLLKGFQGFFPKGRKGAEGGTIPPFLKGAEGEWTLFKGGNSKNNERVTFEIGAKEDWWFHAHSSPGAHVILKFRDTGVKDPQNHIAFLIAAGVALHFSKISGGIGVVDYTQRGNVLRRKGYPPGFVTYHVYSQIRVDPWDERLKPWFSKRVNQN